ncbi:MAG: carbohydrate kinase family protein [Sphaerochaetaceae bacterium]|nr:carbohydrate kinase family protein [Sphaerochaetaceae bacterium]
METDVICMGMALVDSIIKGFDPTPVSKSGFRARSCTLNPGGEAVNEAVTAARLGLRTRILCALGQDMAGSLIEGFLRENSVDTSLIIHPASHSTPVTTMFVNEDGSRKSITNTSHTYNFKPEERLDSLEGTKAIILGSLFRAPFDSISSIKAVVTYAQERGIKVFADTKLPNFRFLSLEDIKSTLPYMDWITPNEDEARYFSGKEEPEEMAKVFLSYGVKNTVIKLGPRGCFYMGESGTFTLPALNIKAVDATGAGDNFIAGLVSELIRGKDVYSALQFANACGAVCSTEVGACTALKSREQVLSTLREFSYDY